MNRTRKAASARLPVDSTDLRHRSGLRSTGGPSPRHPPRRRARLGLSDAPSPAESAGAKKSSNATTIGGDPETRGSSTGRDSRSATPPLRRSQTGSAGTIPACSCAAAYRSGSPDPRRRRCSGAGPHPGGFGAEIERPGLMPARGRRKRRRRRAPPAVARRQRHVADDAHPRLGQRRRGRRCQRLRQRRRGSRAGARRSLTDHGPVYPEEGHVVQIPAVRIERRDDQRIGWSSRSISSTGQVSDEEGGGRICAAGVARMRVDIPDQAPVADERPLVESALVLAAITCE